MSTFSRRSLASLALAATLIGAMAVPALAQGQANGQNGAATGTPAARAGEAAKPAGATAATTPAAKPATPAAAQNAGKPAATGQGATRTN